MAPRFCGARNRPKFCHLPVNEGAVPEFTVSPQTMDEDRTSRRRPPMEA